MHYATFSPMTLHIGEINVFKRIRLDAQFTVDIYSKVEFLELEHLLNAFNATCRRSLI